MVSSCYTLHGYSISENQAHLVFNSFDYRKNYITYYVKVKEGGRGGMGGKKVREGEIDGGKRRGSEKGRVEGWWGRRKSDERSEDEGGRLRFAKDVIVSF